MTAVVEARREDGSTVVWVDRKRRLWLLADVLIGDDPSNPPEEIAAALQADPWYPWIVLAYLPAQYAVLAWSLWYAATHDIGRLGLVGLGSTLGIVTGVGINAAHELGHKREDLEHWASKVALAPTLHGHFFVEHNWGHQKDSRGRYERVTPKHSWNNNHVVTNLLLYQLQRHSDHYENPARRFVALRHVDEAPQLPAGYAAMIMLALVPPLWRRVMDPRLVAHYAGDVSRANTR